MGCDIFLALTSHGYGHASQAAAVVRALRRRRPGLTVTVQARVPRDFLAEVIRGPFDLVAESSDIGLVNRSAFEVDLEASAAAYREFHAHLAGNVAASAAALRAAAPRVLLADVPYVPIAAARSLDIPAVAFCSLNWGGVYAHYLGGRPEAAGILAQIRAAYAAADIFAVTAPGMPMPELPNVRNVGPCAARGVDRRAALAARCGAAPGDRLIMVAVGGFAWRSGYADWPRTPGLHWLVQSAEALSRPDMTRIADAAMPAIDVLASVDAVVGKLGYSLPVEAACHGKPMLYVPRPDWPESPFVAAWMDSHATAAPIGEAALRDGSFVPALRDLLDTPPRPPVPATGAEEIADLVMERLG